MILEINEVSKSKDKRLFSFWKKKFWQKQFEKWKFIYLIIDEGIISSNAIWLEDTIGVPLSEYGPDTWLNIEGS